MPDSFTLGLLIGLCTGVVVGVVGYLIYERARYDVEIDDTEQD